MLYIMSSSARNFLSSSSGVPFRLKTLLSTTRGIFIKAFVFKSSLIAVTVQKITTTQAR
jgi:hypothetical protein